MEVNLPKGWMSQIIDRAFLQKRLTRWNMCVGHFFDNERKKAVCVNLGFVVVRRLWSFRSALLEDEPSNVLSWNSGSAVQNDELPEHAARFFESGFYVIPGLTAMDGINHAD